MVAMQPEVVPYFPASPVGVQTNLGEVAPATLVAIETSLLPGGGSCAITATNQSGRAGVGECQTGIRGTREVQLSGEEVDRDLVHVVVTTWWTSCAAKQLGRRGAFHLSSVVKDPGAQMKRKAGEEKEVKGRIGQRSRPVISP